MSKIPTDKLAASQVAHDRDILDLIFGSFYVYAYLDPRKSGTFLYEGCNLCFLYEPFYIGMGHGDRMHHHLWLAHMANIGNHRLNKIRKIEREGHEVIVFKLFDDLPKKTAIDAERFYIKTIGRADLGTGPLLNRTSGGEGTAELSAKALAERNAKISQSNMGIRVGRTLTHNWKQNIGQGGTNRYQTRYSSFPDMLPELTVKLETRDEAYQYGHDTHGGKNQNAKFYYILIGPNGTQHFVDKGYLKHECVKLGIGEWSMRNSAGYYEKHGKLFVCEKNSNRGWSAVRFRRLEDNPFSVDDLEPSSSNGESSETRDVGSKPTGLEAVDT